MSRELEFRATRKDTGVTFEVLCIDWMHGCVFLDGHMVEVDIDSVVIEQFTGLLDCDDKKIFEGDVLMSKCGEKAFVYFFDGSFMVRIGKYYPVKTHQAYMKDNQFKVIGNIHEAGL